MSASAVNPATGELVDIGHLAREYVRLRQAEEDAVIEAARVRDAKETVERELAAVLPADATVDTGTHIIGWAPPARRPAKRADMHYAEQHREVLEDLGFATRLATIKAADVVAQALKLRAAGVDPERLLPDPGPGRAELRVEVKG